MTRALFAAVASFELFFGVAAYADCSQLPDSISDGQLYLYSAKEKSWALVPANTNLNLSIGPQAKFTYVAREFWTSERAGAVVVKSGRTRQLTEPDRSAERKVKLFREEDSSLSNKRCGAIPAYDRGAVSSENYDAYHDKGEKVSERDKLDAFHIRYAARGANCKDSNSKSPDSVFGGDRRSNRAQFSFDPAVVSTGMYNQVFLAFNVTSAYASSSNLMDQRVEIKRYVIQDKKPVCIAIGVQVTGPALFLRISDLESVQWSGLSVARSPEQSWQLTP